MKILTFKTGHDPAACLLLGGKIIAAAEEERFIRKKHAPSSFPEQAIRYCLQMGSVHPEQLDAVAMGRLTFEKSREQVAQYWLSDEARFAVCMPHSLRQLQSQWRDFSRHLQGQAPYQNELERILGFPVEVYDYDHHECHAASAYYASPLEEATVITYDGKGDGTSTAIWHGKGLELVPLRRYGIAESLGSLYSVLTAYLGFIPNDGEYKVMGLAAYGQPVLDVSPIFDVDEQTIYRMDPIFTMPTLDAFVERFGPPADGENEQLSPFHINLAASFQKQLENVCVHIVREAVRLTGCRTVCIAGGVGLNIKVNHAILNAGVCDRLWVQPAAGDMGNVLGAAYLTYCKLKQKRPEPLSHLYLGPSFSPERIEQALQAAGIPYERAGKKELITRTADYLAAGKIIGWFQGEMEFGPRALGHRSILASPAHESMRDTINQKIKFRESFRPFCPSILAGHGEALMRNYQPSPYMILSFEATDLARKLLPAAVHVDGTIRPQEVESKTDPLYYGLLSAFYEKTGIPALLNTSMNVRGEPMVCTPEDTIRFYTHTHVDGLIIGPFICMKE